MGLADVKASILIFFTLAPLQWIAFGSTPLGLARMHQVAVLGLAAVVLIHYPLRRYAPVLRTSGLFVLANLYMVGSTAALLAYQGKGQAAAVQHLLYLVVFVALGGLFYRVAAQQDPVMIGVLRRVAAVLCTSLLVGLSVAMAVNGVNPAAVLGQTIAAADPEIFQKQIFKSAFAGFGLADEEVAGNLRHEIFGSVLLSMLVSTWAMRIGPTPTKREENIQRASLLLGTILLTLSMSRSVLIAAALWPLLSLIRSGRRGELSTRQIALMMAAVVGVAGLVLSGLGAVIFNRFATDTTGYEARASNYTDAFAALGDHWLVGGYDTANASTHNFVFDTMLRNGILAALPAAIIVTMLMGVFLLLAARLHREPPWMVPVVALLALPLVRLGTSGGGLIPPNEWVALAFTAGVLAYWRRRDAGTVTAAPPAQRAAAGV